jgi:rRNA maturation endonuclease Nob1
MWPEPFGEHLGSQASTAMRQYADRLLYDGNLTETDIEGLAEALEAAKQVIEAIENVQTVYTYGLRDLHGKRLGDPGQ